MKWHHAAKLGKTGNDWYAARWGIRVGINTIVGEYRASKYGKIWELFYSPVGTYSYEKYLSQCDSLRDAKRQAAIHDKHGEQPSIYTEGDRAFDTWAGMGQ